MSFGDEKRLVQPESEPQPVPDQLEPQASMQRSDTVNGKGVGIKKAVPGVQRSKWQLGISSRGSATPGSLAGASRDLDLNRQAQQRQKLHLQQLKSLKSQQLSQQLSQQPGALQQQQAIPPKGRSEGAPRPPRAPLQKAAAATSADPQGLLKQPHGQPGAARSSADPSGAQSGLSGSHRAAASPLAAAPPAGAANVGGSPPSAPSEMSSRSAHSNLPQTPALEAARCGSSEVQPSGFSSPSELAEVQAGNASFNAMQERPLVSKSPLGSFVGTPSEETQAVAAEQLQQRQQAPEQLHHPSVSPFTHASQQQRQPSSDLSEDDCPGDLEAAPTWCSTRRVCVSEARRTSLAEKHDLAYMSLDTRRAASIALERKGIALERRRQQQKKRRSSMQHNPHTQMQRIKEVQLDPQAGGIWVERGWKAADGVRLTDDLVLGKILGSGFQAHVFELLDNDEVVAPIVLKASKSRALISDTQREWATGQRLAALGPGDALLPGIMKTGPAVCRVRKRAEKKGSKLVGMFLERMNGKSVSKVIGSADFCDVQYIRDMLFEVFTALDAAQRAFGFHHYDMRLDNVMEHTPDPSHSAQDPISIGLVGDLEDRVRERTFKVIDFGLAKFDEMYAADEGADTGADLVGEDSSSGSPWYLAPLACMSSTPEAVHKAAWRGKGDVYHLLFDLSMAIHGRVWPEKDRPAVKRLMSLIRHVTGTVPGAAFAKHPEDAAEAAACMPVQCFGIPNDRRRGGVVGLYTTIMQRSFATKWLRQLKAWQFPTNPGLTASEVLTSPFFR